MDSSVTAPLYRDITDFAHDMPSWVQHLAEIWTELGLLVFGVLFITGWWRARNQDDRALALAVLAPVATAFGYVASEVLKSMVNEERPCRSVAGAAASLVTCPPHGRLVLPQQPLRDRRCGGGRPGDRPAPAGLAHRADGAADGLLAGLRRRALSA